MSIRLRHKIILSLIICLLIGIGLYGQKRIEPIQYDKKNISTIHQIGEKEIAFIIVNEIFQNSNILIPKTGFDCLCNDFNKCFSIDSAGTYEGNIYYRIKSVNNKKLWELFFKDSSSCLFSIDDILFRVLTDFTSANHILILSTQGLIFYRLIGFKNNELNVMANDILKYRISMQGETPENYNKKLSQIMNSIRRKLRDIYKIE